MTPVPWQTVFSVWRDEFATPSERKLNFDSQVECFAHWLAMKSKDWNIEFNDWIDAMELTNETEPEQLSFNLREAH